MSSHKGTGDVLERARTLRLMYTGGSEVYEIGGSLGATSTAALGTARAWPPFDPSVTTLIVTLAFFAPSDADDAVFLGTGRDTLGSGVPLGLRDELSAALVSAARWL